MIDARLILMPTFLEEEEIESIGRSITTAYKACDDFMSSSPVTSNFMVGMDMRSRIISPFVEHALTKLDSFTYEIKPNAAKNCWHTRLYKNGMAFTAHFLGRNNLLRKMPKKAVNRVHLAGRNNDLFSDLVINSEAELHHGYSWILHSGYDQPKYASIAIPSQDQSNIIAATPVPLPEPKVSDVEQIRDEMAIELLSVASEANEKTG